jgi:nitrogen-specific signal transduction histidine kinase
MGLDIALRVVRQFGGSILLDSKPGRTEFHVSLPVSRSAEPASTGAAS